MFDVVTDRPRRRVWTPRTVAVSAGAHLLLLGVFVTAAESTPAKAVRMDTTLVVFPLDPPPPAPAPTDPRQTKGDYVAPRAPEKVPATIPPPDPHATPVHDERNPRGIPGDVIAPPDPPPAVTPTPRPAETFPVFGGGDEVIDAESATVLPHLENERDARRMLQRAYPPRLRDEGITGRATVVVIIDRNGNVEPGSVRVQDATHPAFEEAARRAVEKFHFTPAELHGQTIAVVLALPIRWDLQH
jgi:TonB family protein